MRDDDGADRITFDGNVLDEVVINSVTRIEVTRLDAHRYQVVITGADGELIQLQGNNLVLGEHRGDQTTEQVRPALRHCGLRWGRPGLEHTCTAHQAHRGQHRCDCGAQERNKTVRGARGR